MTQFTDRFKQMNKTELVEKPGNATHSEKWDRCVQSVKESGHASNAYAVCTAAMGEESFKSMGDAEFSEKIKMYMQKLGIADAGLIPNSLLAEQDLEPKVDITRLDREWFVSAEKSMYDIRNFAVWYYDKQGARKCAVFNNWIDADAYAKLVNVLGYKRIKIMKSKFEQTGEALKEVQEEAKEDESSPKKLINRIKNIQLERQKTVLNMRKGNNKSFNQVWSDNKGQNINFK